MTPGLRLRRLIIENYKKLNQLEIDFPKPKMERDLDILILGSKNGGGKTSVLECCSLLILAGIESRIDVLRESGPMSDISNLLVKSGCKNAKISGEFEQGDKKCTISLEINKNKFVSEINGDKLFSRKKGKRSAWDLDYALSSVLAFSGEPLIIPPLMHFNSYRKVQESNPELGMMAEEYDALRMMRYAGRSGIRTMSTPISSFKLEILRSLMGKASLFEGSNKEESAWFCLN